METNVDVWLVFSIEEIEWALVSTMLVPCSMMNTVIVPNPCNQGSHGRAEVCFGTPACPTMPHLKQASINKG